MTALSDPRLQKLNGFQVEIDAARERADIILDRPPLNVIEMAQRDQLRLVFEALDDDASVRVIVLRAKGEHFSSGGNIAEKLIMSGNMHVGKIRERSGEAIPSATKEGTQDIGGGGSQPISVASANKSANMCGPTSRCC